MRKPVFLKYLGFTGTGKTKREAREDASLQIEKLNRGDWTPILLEWHGDAILIFRTIHGWEYSFIRQYRSGLGMRGTCIGDGELDSTLRNAKNALVQSAWQPDMPLDSFPEWFTDERDMQRQRSDRERLLRVTQLIKQGHTASTALDMVFAMNREPELVSQ
jgi:hypothetical protein